MMHRKAADLQYQRPFHLNSSLVPFVVEILIADYPNTVFVFHNFAESYNSTRTKGKSLKDLPFLLFCELFKSVARKRAAFAFWEPICGTPFLHIGGKVCTKLRKQVML